MSIHHRFYISPSDSPSPSTIPTESPEPACTPPESLPEQTPYQVSITKSMSYVLSWTYCKTVTMTVTDDISYSIIYTFFDGTFYESITAVFSKSYFPYIIEVLTPSYVKTDQVFELVAVKKKMSPEQLIGVVCGAVAGAFLIIVIVIFIIRKRNNNFQFSGISSVTDSSIDNEQNPDSHMAEGDFNLNEMSIKKRSR